MSTKTRAFDPINMEDTRIRKGLTIQGMEKKYEECHVVT
jgi:hypothetical protein